LLGIGHTNPITGDMSAVSPETFLIENGEITHAIEPVNVAGNVYKNLKYIKMLGSDVLLTPFGVKTPSLVIDNFSITG
jgi:predicted Zn-dependent protease